MRLVKLLLVLGLVWTAYWGLSAFGLQRGVTHWFSEQERQGWLAQHQGLSAGGYPLRHQMTITGPTLADPGTGKAWSADWVAINSSALWPGDLTLSFPETTQRFTHLGQTVSLTTQALAVDLSLAPGVALALDHLHLSTEGWQVELGSSPLMKGGELDFTANRLKAPSTYAMTVDLKDLFLRDQRRPTLAATPTDLVIPSATLRAQVTFDTAWDRRAIELRSPQPQGIDLEAAKITLGDAWVEAQGHVFLDETGLPEGEITLHLTKWQNLLRLAERTGRITPDQHRALRRVATVLDRSDTDTEPLEITLRIVSGWMSLGPIPIGPAPRLVLR